LNLLFESLAQLFHRSFLQLSLGWLLFLDLIDPVSLVSMPQLVRLLQAFDVESVFAIVAEPLLLL
jgi:hypothetical protein